MNWRILYLCSLGAYYQKSKLRPTKNKNLAKDNICIGKNRIDSNLFELQTLTLFSYKVAKYFIRNTCILLLDRNQRLISHHLYNPQHRRHWHCGILLWQCLHAIQFKEWRHLGDRKMSKGKTIHL